MEKIKYDMRGSECLTLCPYCLNGGHGLPIGVNSACCLSCKCNKGKDDKEQIITCSHP